jgi:hypothetical protein
MPRKASSFDEIAKFYGTPLRPGLPPEPRGLDEAKLNEVDRQQKAAWQHFLNLVRALPVDLAAKKALASAAGKAIRLNSEAWNISAQAVMDYNEYHLACNEHLAAKVKNHGKGPRLRHDRATQRHAIIREKLAEQWNRNTIFQFLSEQRPDLIKGVSSAENMMKTFRRSNQT